MTSQHQGEPSGQPDTTVPAVIYDDNWYDRAPAMLRDFAGPDGEDCPTPIDRRWLWRIENFLAVCGTTNYHRQMTHDLRVYLHQSCQHQWRIDEAGSWWGDSPRMRQCLWCSHVDVIDEDGAVVAEEDRTDPWANPDDLAGGQQ